MSDQRYGLGLVGCGAFGLFCLDAFSKMEEVQVTAVADVRTEVADSFAREFSVPAYYTALELINDPNVQIVHIATPPSSHHELVLAAAQAGKSVLCEKPLAMNLQQADDMLASAARASVIAPVNFVLRYNDVSRAVGRIIESGILGKPLSARLYNCASDSSLDQNHWFWNKSVSGGIFIEHGVHFFDLYSSWLGEGKVIDAHTEVRPDTTQEDRVMCTVRHTNGAVVSHYHGFDQFSLMDRTDHRIVFELGDIRINGWIPLEMTLDAVLDEEGTETLGELCPDAEISVLEQIDPNQQNLHSRGVERNVSQRIHMDFMPNADKQAVYSQSIQKLLADQIAYLRDNNHSRQISESNGRNSLMLACQAANLAEQAKDK